MKQKKTARLKLAAQIGKRIRKIRGDRTMAEFSALFDAVPGTLANYENGSNVPGAYVLREIALREKVSLDYLVLGRGLPHR